MLKFFQFTCAFLIVHDCTAQKTIEASNAFTIEGLVEKSLIINLDSIKGQPGIKIDSVVIANHLGQRKSSLKNITVIPLKYFLDQVVITLDNPKQLSEVYFVFTATDGYKVVFSWNEIYNNSIGRELYIIAGKEGKGIENLEDRIAIFSQTDLMKGRRYVKGLNKIVVKRAE